MIMHEGMGGPHLFEIPVKSSDPEKPTTILKVKGDIVSLKKWRRSHPEAFYLPRELANFKLRFETVGAEIIPKSLKAFANPEDLKNVYLGSYRQLKKETRLLVAEYADAKEAQKNLSIMIEYAKKSTEKPDQLIQKKVAGNAVYFFNKGDSAQFYFQKANKVFLLFPDKSATRQSLDDVLKHIQAS